jgi:hypothetical protein
MIRVIAIAMTLAACGSSESKTTVDANPLAPDAPTCTGKTYEPCTDATQCTSGMCHLYMGTAIQVCTQACSASNPCPDYNGMPVTCNMMGNCKPPAALACTR